MIAWIAWKLFLLCATVYGGSIVVVCLLYIRAGWLCPECDAMNDKLAQECKKCGAKIQIIYGPDESCVPVHDSRVPA